jgi:hypothetical protein
MLRKTIKTINFLLVFILLLMTACQKQLSEREQNIRQIVQRHIQMRPDLRVDDVYKLLYQNRMGIGHLITDTLNAKKYLMDEVQSIDANDTSLSESLIEWISNDSTMVRINLRTFKKQNLSTNHLFQAMLGTVANHKQDKKELIGDWNVFVNLLKNGELTMSQTGLEEFNAMAEQKQYPVVHHSADYTKQYKPAYRVILHGEWKKYF